MKVLMALLLLLPVVAFAEPADWLKKSNPNELAANNLIGTGCPFSLEQTEDVMSGVLVRTRIKRLEYRSKDDIFLFITHTCVTGRKPAFYFSMDIHFAKWGEESGNPIITYPLLMNYGVSGQAADSDQYLSYLRTYVENAVTEYLKANFDLGGSQR